MANKASNTEKVVLEDGTVCEIKSLTIKNLRRFMNQWQSASTSASEDPDAGADQGFDTFIRVCGIALEKPLAEKFPEPENDDGTIDEDYKDYLEDNLDMENIYKILEVSAGLNLRDPKLMAAAERAAREVGTA